MNGFKKLEIVPLVCSSFLKKESHSVWYMLVFLFTLYLAKLKFLFHFIKYFLKIISN